MDWSKSEVTGKRPTDGLDVSPAEIRGERGFFVVPTVKKAIVPPSILAAAIACAGVTPDAEGMWAFYRSGRAGKLIIIEPVKATKEDLALEHDADQDGFRRYRNLADVQLPQSIWRWADMTFPCTLYAWHHEGKVYVRRRVTQEDWDASAPRWEYVIPTLRKVVGERGGFPALSGTGPPRR